MVLAFPFPAMPLMSAVHSSCFVAPCNSVDEFVSMCAALPCFPVPCNAVDELMSAVYGSCIAAHCNAVNEFMSAVYGSCFPVPCNAVDEFVSMCAALPCFPVPCNAVDERGSWFILVCTLGGASHVLFVAFFLRKIKNCVCVFKFYFFFIISNYTVI